MVNLKIILEIDKIQVKRGFNLLIQVNKIYINIELIIIRIYLNKNLLLKY